MPKVMSHLLIADSKNRLQFAEKWGWIMIKKPHAEETVTGIPVIQPSVSKWVKVIPGWSRQRQAEDLTFIQKMHHEIMSWNWNYWVKIKYKEGPRLLKMVNQKCLQSQGEKPSEGESKWDINHCRYPDEECSLQVQHSRKWLLHCVKS